MSSPLDSSVTLGDALELVESRRIPIAPEVAGYLCLELAERASMQSGGLLPEGIFLGEEGSVAFVPRTDTETPEVFVRSLLKRLLEASASRPAALWQVTASTRPGLEGLVRELEAALIPLNRMASRRSLARLAREVKRVTHGVGRNAPSSVRTSPQRASSPPSKLPPPNAPPRASASVPPASAPPAPPSSIAPAATPPAATPASMPPPVSPSAAPARLSAIDELLNALDPVPQPEAPVAEATTRRQLKEMAGLDPTPPPPTAARYEDDEPLRHDDELEDDDAHDEQEPTAEESEAIEALLVASAAGPQGRLAEAMRPSAPRVPAVTPRSERLRTHSTLPEHPSAPLPPVAARTIDVDPPGLSTSARSREATPRELRRSTPPGLRSSRRSTGGGRTIAVTLLFVFGLGLGLVYLLRPQWMLGHELATPSPSASAAPLQAPASACAIRVTGAPEGAEILLLEGHAPLDVSPMPAGARIEFVGLLAGHAPKRAVVPAQGKWDQDERGRPRYELALELAPSRKKSDPWPPAEPGTTVGGEGEPGTVRVVSSPRDAEVWLLFGSGPDAVLDPVPCKAHEILVASGTAVRTRLPIAAEDFLPSADSGVSWVTVDAKRPVGGR